MDRDDVIYLSLLIFKIVFGYFFKNLHEAGLKKWISTFTGLVFVIIVSGRHALHPIICMLINAGIILGLENRICHIISFCFSFLYLIFFRTSAYIGIPYASSHTNLIQMILTLKLIGLAFEVHDSNQSVKDEKVENENKKKINITFFDILHYSFCYIGVLTGPYYSYKTFSDYFENGYTKYAPCEKTTLKRLTFVPLYAVLFLLCSYHYPIKYVDSDEFYTVRSFWYRLFYIIPVFITFRMRMYIGFILSECACIMAGLGAYPSMTKPKSGHGPTENISKMKELSPEALEKVDFNFNTVKNIDVRQTEFNPSFRSSILFWNMCVQYWMAFFVYKRFPIKASRTVATFAVSAIWHGIYGGYFLCLCAVPLYLQIESIWEELLRTNAVGTKRKILDVVFWFVRTQAFSYMGMAFSLLTMERGIKYYSSVYYVYHLTSVIFLVVGLLLSKPNRSKPPAQKN